MTILTPSTKRTRPTFHLTNKAKIKVIRPGEVSLVNGRKVVGEPSKHFIYGHVQPLRFRELMILPETDRTKEWVKLYTNIEEDIRAALEGDDGHEADHFLWNGFEYKVMMCHEYLMGVLDHKRIHATRVPISAGPL